MHDVTQVDREAPPCPRGPNGKHQLDTSMESGPNNCFFCGCSLKGMRYEGYRWDEDLVSATKAKQVAENAALRDRVAMLEGELRWIGDTLIELNPNNYNHDDVCEANAAAVEVMLRIDTALKDTTP